MLRRSHGRWVLGAIEVVLVGRENSEPLGARLRQLRGEAGLTQEELAQRSGLSVRMVSNLERGRTRRPYPSSVRSPAHALGLPGDDLVARHRATRSGLPQPAGEAAAVPRQLLAAVPHFTGRDAELKILNDVLESGTGTGETVCISAIGGTAGVGKTALAVYWAHLVASRFPDGQLYVNLRGYDPSGRPADPAAAVRACLGALGVTKEHLPADPDGQGALYRSLLAGRRILIVLDNARDAAQVRPLLPGSSECLVVITSRRQLTALATADGAQLLDLDVLSEAEAAELLTARLSASRVAAESGAVHDLIESCARLPLALSIVEPGPPRGQDSASQP